MRQIFLDKEKIVVKEVCQPILDDNCILVSVHYSFISSFAELATIKKTEENNFLSNVPQRIKKAIQNVSKCRIKQTACIDKKKIKNLVHPLGYSCSGEVIAVGKNIKNIRHGDLVACAGENVANHADIICVPEHLVAKVEKEEFLQHASVTTMGSVALQGIRRAQLQLDEHVCIIGLGILGQLSVQMANTCGCNVTAIDVNSERLKLAKELGASETLHATEDNVLKDIKLFTNNHGVDCTIITACSKSDFILQQAMQITRKKGKVILVGNVGTNIEPAPFYKKEIDLLISCSYGPGRYDYEYEHLGKDYPYPYVRWTEHRNMQTFVNLIENKKINIKKVISKCFSIKDFKKAYDSLESKKILGVIIDYLPKTKNIQSKKSTIKSKEEIRFIPAIKDRMRVGIVGAGTFCKKNIMPIVYQQKNVIINALVDKDVTNSINTSRAYKTKNHFTNSSNLFKNDLVDVVVVSSEHKNHSKYALEALEHGKAVFLEKPMVTKFDQLERMKNFIQKNPQAPFCVDYSRSFSPFIQKIKRVVNKRKSPLIIHYRMSVELMQYNRSAQEDMGAGRIIGEACNIFDIFSFLTDSSPLAVSVDSLRPTGYGTFPTDNFCAQVVFKDGSICSLLYTTLGHQNIGRERMEVFFDSKSIVMENYKILKGFGLSKSFDQCTAHPDKGRLTLIEKFFDELKKKKFSPPINFNRLHEVANLTLVVDQLACQGGGEKIL